MNKTVYQPYHFEVKPANEVVEGWAAYRENAPFVSRVWKTNSRGARGDLYRGQALRIAVFGTSTTASTTLTQSDTWPEQMRLHLGDVHVDNFARNRAGSREAYWILRDLAKRSIRYDLVLIMVRPSLGNETKFGEKEAFDYWGRRTNFEGQFALNKVVSHWWDHDVRSRFSRKKKRGSRPPRWLDPNDKPNYSKLPWPPKPWSRLNRRIRGAPWIQYADDPANFTLPRWQFRQSRKQALELFHQARRVTEHVVYLTEPVAFDEFEVQEVSRRWFLLNPVKGREGYFISNRSHAFIRRKRSHLMAEVAREMEIPVYDIDLELRVLLRQRGDLFMDHNHFTPQGSRVAGGLIAGFLKTLPLWPSVFPASFAQTSGHLTPQGAIPLSVSSAPGELTEEF